MLSVIIAPGHHSVMYLAEGIDHTPVEKMPYELLPAVMAHRENPGGGPVRTAPVVEAFFHPGDEHVRDAALGQNLGHLGRPAGHVRIKCGIDVTSPKVILHPFPPVICLPDKLFSGGETFIRLIIGGPPGETPFPEPLFHLGLPFGTCFQEFHQIQGLFHLESER